MRSEGDDVSNMCDCWPMTGARGHWESGACEELDSHPQQKSGAQNIHPPVFHPVAAGHPWGIPFLVLAGEWSQ